MRVIGLPSFGGQDKSDIFIFNECRVLLNLNSAAAAGSPSCSS
jgi:hypothetical protein